MRRISSIIPLTSRRPQHGADSLVNPLVLRHFGVQLFLPGRRQRVEAHLTVGFGRAPFRLDQALAEQALQRRIERTLFDPQLVSRQGMDTLRDRITVKVAGAQDAKNEKCQRTWRHLWIRHKVIMPMMARLSGSVKEPRSNDIPAGVEAA